MTLYNTSRYAKKKSSSHKQKMKSVLGGAARRNIFLITKRSPLENTKMGAVTDL
jgi:hypothetical protein